MTITAEQVGTRGPEGLIFLPEAQDSTPDFVYVDSEPEEGTLFTVIDLRETVETPDIDFWPKTQNTDAEFGRHRAIIYLGRSYAHGLSLAQKEDLLQQLEGTVLAWETEQALDSTEVERRVGMVAVATSLEL